MPQVFGFLHIGYLVALGVAGWTLVLLATLYPGFLFTPVVVTWEHFACIVMMGVARLLTFQIFGRARVALDSAFYIAAYFVFGGLAAAWMVLLTITLDGLQRLATGTGLVARGEAPLRHSISYAIYNGGLPSLVLLLLGGFFGIAFQGDGQINYSSDFDLSWQVPLFAVIFLLGYYAIAGQATWFAGREPAKLVWRKFVVRVVGVELLLVPMSLAMVLGYRHQGIGLFLLIGSTGLLFGGIFKGWTEANSKVQRRVVELSVLNQIARAISTSTEQEVLWTNIAKATVDLVGKESFLTMGVVDEAQENVHYRVFDGEAKVIHEIVLSPDRGIAGWVLSNRRTLNVGDLQKDYSTYAGDETYNDPTFNSWLGVPLQVSDDVVGVMSVQSREREAYTEDHLRVLATIADQAAVAIENSRLYQLATVDGLTGLFVRRYFDQRLVEEWGRSNRYGSTFSLGIYDLDHFKKFNDTYGHQLGDKVLRAAAQILRDNMRSFDLAARYGGEEFVFILPRTGFDEALRVAERIRVDTEAMITMHEGQGVKVTCSIGISACPHQDIHDSEELLAAADRALYEAKNNGRNRVESGIPPDKGL